LLREGIPFPEDPAALLGKFDHCTLRLEEEEVLGVGNGEGRVCVLSLQFNIPAGKDTNQKLCRF
jgi:hypothetical protein